MSFAWDQHEGGEAGLASDGAELIVLPLEVACAETTLCGLRGLIDGRHKVRVGLLERSAGRWAEAASLDLSLALLATFAICCWRFSIRRLKLAVTPAC